MDQKELAEALPRLREEALKAEEALRVAQERLHEADQRMAKILTYVEVHDDQLVVDRRGSDKMIKLLGRLTIPLEHVVRAEADPNIVWTVWRGWLVPGVRVPGVASTRCTVTERRPLWSGLRTRRTTGSSRRSKTLLRWLRRLTKQSRLYHAPDKTQPLSLSKGRSY